MTNRFNDGIIDLSSLREKKAEQTKPAPPAYDPDLIMKTIPSEFQATDDNDNELVINVISVAIMPDKIYLILTDGQEGEPPFLMIGRHENNRFTEELTPASEQDLADYNDFVAKYKEAQAEEAANSQQDERQAQLQEMLEKAETEEEREQIRAMLSE